MNAIIKYVIPVLGVIGGIIFVMTVNDVDSTESCVSCAPANNFLIYSYILFGLCILATLANVVTGIMSKPENLKASLIGLGAMVVVIGISYALADGTVLEKYGKDISETEVKWSDTGLYAFYILFIGAIGSVVFSSVNAIIKR